jgi:hypothetical protein
MAMHRRRRLCRSGSTNSWGSATGRAWCPTSPPEAGCRRGVAPLISRAWRSASRAADSGVSRRESHGDASPATPLQIRLDELVGLGDRTVARLAALAGPNGSPASVNSKAWCPTSPPEAGCRRGVAPLISRAWRSASRASTYSSRYVPHIGGQSVCCSATTPSAGPSSAS